MISLSTLIIALSLYVLLLFLVAGYGEKASKKAGSFFQSPYVYSLSLAVYCTSWTYYGSVGSASTNGFLFLAIYLGPTLSIILWWEILRKLTRLKNQFNMTSLVDFISVRYDKSEGLAILATIFILFGIIPYISLQLMAVTKTISLLSSTNGHEGKIGPYVVLLMTVCSIVFGMRKLNTTERHPGMVLVLAFECLLKLGAFLAVGIFVTYVLNNGFADIFSRIPAIYQNAPLSFMGHGDNHEFTTWITYLLLASSAILFLPRQFQIAVVENNDEKHIKTAKWVLPLYLFLINIFVLPMAIGGKSVGLPADQADYFVLLLAQLKGNTLFTLMVFLGGFSAAAGMVLIETVTISTMITNNIFLPVFTRVKSLQFMTRHLLKLRWLSAMLLMIFSYAYMMVVSEKLNLISIGMISFAAALQFAPMILGALYSRKGSKAGAFAGFSMGAIVWFYTLVVPTLIASGFLDQSISDHGLFQISWLKPEALFGMKGMNYLTHAVFWSLFFNISGYLLFSMLYPASISEQRIAEEFVTALPKEKPEDFDLGEAYETISLEEKKKDFIELLSQYCTETECQTIWSHALKKTGLENKIYISVLKLAELTSEIEKALSGFIGTAGAHNSIVRSDIIGEAENESLTQIYSTLLSSMRINPAELRKQIILYREKEIMMQKEAQLLEDVIQKKAAELEEQKNLTFHASKMAALGEMAAGIAHEINNPLSIISLNNHMLQHQIENNHIDRENLKRYIQNIDLTVLRISKIIKGLRTISRDDSNEEFAMTKFGDVLDDVLALSGEKFKVHGIILKTDVPEDIHEMEIKCRRVQLSQVFINLLANAYDSVEDRKNPWISLSARIEGQSLVVRITDSGPGISRELQEKIFQPFFTTKEVGKGTGLGLSLSSSIIRAHKGEITVDNTSPTTCFVIKLPIGEWS